MNSAGECFAYQVQGSGLHLWHWEGWEKGGGREERRKREKEIRILWQTPVFVGILLCTCRQKLLTVFTVDQSAGRQLDSRMNQAFEVLKKLDVTFCWRKVPRSKGNVEAELSFSLGNSSRWIPAAPWGHPQPNSCGTLYVLTGHAAISLITCTMGLVAVL